MLQIKVDSNLFEHFSAFGIAWISIWIFIHTAAAEEIANHCCDTSTIRLESWNVLFENANINLRTAARSCPKSIKECIELIDSLVRCRLNNEMTWCTVHSLRGELRARVGPIRLSFDVECGPLHQIVLRVLNMRGY